MASKVEIDNIDIEILQLLEKNPMKILELTEKIGMAHKNILLHLNKLEENDLIERDNSLKGRSVLLKLKTPQKMASFELDAIPSLIARFYQKQLRNSK